MDGNGSQSVNLVEGLYVLVVSRLEVCFVFGDVEMVVN